MANVYAVKSGNWSDVTVWNTGALPTSADDVYSNNFTINVDTTATVLTIRNTSGSGINQGGNYSLVSGCNLTCTASNGIVNSAVNMISFSQNTTVNISANINALGWSGYGALINFTGSGIVNWTGSIAYPTSSRFGNQIITVSNTTVNHNGNLTVGDQTNGGPGGNKNAIYFINSGILNVNGNLIGGGGTFNHTPCIYALGGVINITGNCTAGSQITVVDNNAVSTINITGTCTGGGNVAVSNSSTGTINVTGSVTSSGSANGISNSSTGTINITGTCAGGSSTGGAFVNSSTGTITHIGTAQASATAAAIGPGAAGQVTILTGPLLSTDASYTGATSSGVNPCIALRWFPADTALSTFEYRMRGQTLSGSPSIRPARQMFLTDNYAATYPATSNVRSAITYGPGSIYIGTCAVPPAGSVALGVPVDNTTGTAAIDGASIRTALGLASANLDSQLDALPTATEAATAVRTELTTELSRIDASVSSRLAPSGTLARVTLADTVTTLTNAPDVPTETEIADAVRTELTPELARLSNAATVQNVADIVEGAFELPEI